MIEWEADTTNEIAFGFETAELASRDCPFCEAHVPPYFREIRFGSSTLPELVARRRHPWGA